MILQQEMVTMFLLTIVLEVTRQQKSVRQREKTTGGFDTCTCEITKIAELQERNQKKGKRKLS